MNILVENRDKIAKLCEEHNVDVTIAVRMYAKQNGITDPTLIDDFITEYKKHYYKKNVPQWFAKKI